MEYADHVKVQNFMSWKRSCF